MLRIRSPYPYTILKYEEIQRMLDDRTVLIVYMPMLDNDMRGGLAHLIIDPKSTWVGMRFDEEPYGDVMVTGDTTFSLSTQAMRLWDLRRSIQSDPGPAEVDHDALIHLAGGVGALLLGQESLDELSRLRNGGKDRLLISPYGPFHFCPIHLLGPAGRPLLDDWNVAYLPNIDLLLKRYTRRPRVQILTSIGLDYINPPHPELPPLRGAISEATECATLFGTQPVLNTSATRQRVFEALRDSRYVHIAAHGAHNVDAPAFQAIYLAPSGEDDGRLFAYDLLGHNFSGIELVTLSACETGLGRIDRTDNLRGMPAALFLAGVPAIIATMWPVSDVAAAYFFPALYSELARGHGIWEAFRTAQQMTRIRFPQYRDWGAFALMGRPLDD